MKNNIKLSFVFIGLILFSFSVTGYAQYTADNLFTFLQDTYNRHDKKTGDFLISELNQFLQTFPDNEHCADVNYMITKVYEENGKKHETLAAAFKILYLYPNINLRTDCSALLTELVTKEKPYRDKKDFLFVNIGSEFLETTITDRYYAYLNFLMELDVANLYDWTMNEAKWFVNRFPNDSRLYSVLQWIGDLYVKSGEEREAVICYQKLEWMYPDNPLLSDVRYNRARLLYEKLGEYENAVKVCNQIIIAYPESEVAGLSFFMMGEIRENKLKDYKGAVDAYRKLVDTYPMCKKSNVALLSIGEINLKRLKNYDASIAAYNEFVEKYRSDPHGVDALEKVADIYYDDLKDYSKAAEYYARISEYYPTYNKAPEMLIKAGTICEEKLLDSKRAIEYYQLVVDKYPDDKKAKDASKKIANVKNVAGK